MKQRLHYFDMLKGMAIFAVVMGHVITFCVRDIDQSLVFKLAEKIHMPLFFFISGYFSYKAQFATPKLWSRFKQLMIPFFVVSAIWVWYFPHSGIQTPFDGSLRDMYFSLGKLGYWFNPCLFGVILIYALLTPALRSTKSFALTASIALITEGTLFALMHYLPSDINNLLGTTNLVIFFPIFMVGVFSKKYQDQYNMITTNQWLYTGAILIGSCLLYVTMYYWEFPVIKDSGLIVKTLIILWHLCLVIIAVNVTRPWSEKAYSNHDSPTLSARIWSYLGQKSLAIYLTHYFFLFPMSFMQEPLRAMSLDFVPTFFFAAIVAAAIISVSLGAIYLIQRSKVLALLLTGQS